MTRPLRVLFVNPGTEAQGGAERSLLGLVTGLRAWGVDVMVATGGEGSLVRELLARSIPAHALPSGRFRPAARFGGQVGKLTAVALSAPTLARQATELRRLVRAWQPDIVHTNGLRAHVLTPLLRIRGARVVVTLRDIPQSALEREPLRLVVDRADAVIANSRLTAASWRTNRHRTVVIDNPVEPPTPRPRAEARRRLGVPPDAFVVANLAHFHWLKGQLDLVAAAASLSESAHVLLAGGDLYGDASTAYRAEVEAAVAASPARERIHFLGMVDDVSWVYGAADVVAHCSVRPESFGRTIVEALLAGVPVVSSDAGTPGELLRGCSAAWLYPAGDHVALRNALVRLGSDPQLKNTMAAAAAAWAPTRYSIRVHIESCLRVYTAVLRCPESVPD
ncbi:MAG: glycosyltransferase family 4 protein [Acidimicrobiales bacterium]|nr:glycosyltransferase family 4 protein [Acidimicrobiales bacterium]